MPLPVYESSGTIVGDGGTSVTLTYPTGSSVNDIIISVLGDADNDTFTVPTGWTRIHSDSASNNCSYDTMWRRYDGTEGSTETFNSAVNAGSLVWGVLHRFSGCDTTTTPVGGGVESTVANQTTHSITGVVGITDSLKVAVHIIEDNVALTRTSNGDWTERDAQSTAVGSDGWLVCETSSTISSSDSSYTTGTNEYSGSVGFYLLPGGYVYSESITITTNNSISDDVQVDFNPTLELSLNNVISITSIAEFNSSLTLSSDNIFDENNINEISSDTLLTLDAGDTESVNVISEFLTNLVIAGSLSTEDAIIYLNTTSMSSNHGDLYDVLINYVGNLTLPININQTSTVISDFLSLIDLNIDIEDIYNVGFDIQKSLTITGSANMSTESVITYVYEESVELLCMIQLETAIRKTELFTLISIGVIKNIGKIK